METLAGSNGVRMRSYDPFADAQQRGIEVQYLPITAASIVWMPAVDGVVISSHVETTRERRDLLAHSLAHADIEKTSLMWKFRHGRATRDQVELRVRRIASRRLVRTEQLHEALRQSTSAVEIAEHFDVPIGTLADRIRDLSMREYRAFGKLLAPLEWPRYAHTPALQNCAVDCAAHIRLRDRITGSGPAQAAAKSVLMAAAAIYLI